MYSLNGDVPTWPGPAFFSSDFYSHIVVEEMTDEVGGQTGKIKPLDHCVTEFYGDAGNVWKYHSGSNIVEDTGPSAVWWGHGSYPSWAGPLTRRNWRTVYHKDTNAQLNETIDKFNSSNDVDNILNLAEAHQIPSALGGLAKTLNSENVINALRKRPRNGSIGKQISNSYLAWSFGIAPLIADMKTMNKAMKSLHSDMVKDRGRRAQIDTVTTKLFGRLERSSDVDWFPGYFTTDLVVPKPPQRIVGVKGVRTQQYNSNVFADADYLLRRFGGPGPASYVWEKIPYSFVVDWFFNLKGITDCLDNLLTGNTKKINAAWTSETISGIWSSRFINPNAIEPSIGTTMFTNTIDSYTRSPLSSTRPAVTLSGRFGKKQMGLAAALLYQKVARR